MPIDPSIIMGVRAPQIQQRDPMDVAQKGLAIKALMGQGEMQNMQLDQARRGMERDAQVREAYRQSQGDRSTLRRLLMEAGAGREVQELDKFDLDSRNTNAQIDQRTAAAAKSRHEIAIDAIQRGASILSTATDQPTYDAARRSLALTLGPEIVAGMPEQFDPNFIATKIAEGQTVTQRLQDQRARETLDATKARDAVVAANKPFNADGTPNAPVQQFQMANSRAGAANIVQSTGGLMPGTGAKGKIDEGLLDTSGRLLRLSQIEKGYRPEFQQVGPRLSASWSSIKEKAGVGLSQTDQTALRDFSAYKRNAIDSLNLYIKEITGAAMSIPEAERITRAMPNAGQGIFDGDSPTEFKSKLDDAIRGARMAEARFVYLKRNGMSLTDAAGNPIVPLERMPSLMNERGRELEQAVKRSNPSANAQDIRKMVTRQLAQEFGLAAD
jgi:hypothetical protein